jgi:hypothetical protein
MISTPSGKQPGDIYLASVTLSTGGVKIECYDNKLKEQLKEIFSQPIVKKVDTVRRSKIISHRNEVVQVFTEEYFREVIFNLHRYNLYGKLQ